MIIVETKREHDELLGKISSNHFIFDIVPIDDERHAAISLPSLIFFYFTGKREMYCLPINHAEAVNFPESIDLFKGSLKMSIGKKMVFDKKSIVQILGQDYDFIDLNVVRYLADGSVVDLDLSTTNAHLFIKTRHYDKTNINKCVPLYKHARVFMDKIDKFGSTDLLESNFDASFKFMNETMIDCFAKLEGNGLHIDKDLFVKAFGDNQLKYIKDNKVYSQYNLFTSTGRPSNRYGGVNYAALKKTGGERDSFVSRFGSDGMLVMMDYNAFHPRLIAHLTNFNLPNGENPYEYLARYYFNKKDVDEEDIAVSKGLTFQMLYGGIDKRWVHIPYFAKIQEYIDHRWRFFEENGYIETPRYLRKIKHCHIQEATPNKLFNYILQALETEMAVGVLNTLQTHLASKQTKPVLYTYDSILFDAHKSDGKDTIRQIKSIMESDKFPVKVYAGKSYSSLAKIELG